MARPAKTTALTAPAVDTALLDGAVDFINRATRTAGLQIAKTVSEYVTDTFFSGDVALISSKDPTKNASFRALCQRPDLQMGASTLNNLVRIGLQVQHLPADLADNLTMTHHRALLAVKQAPHKQKLARQAVKYAWTVQQLKATIAAEHPQPTNHAGRPAKAALLKWLEGLQKASGDRQAGPAFAAEFAELKAVEQAAFQLELAALVTTLAAMVYDV